MKPLVRKINDTPLLWILFFLTLFFLPFQERYHKPLRKLSQFAFGNQYFPPFFFEKTLDFYLTDFFLLGILCLSLWGAKNLFWDKSRKYLLLFLLFAFFSILFSSQRQFIWPYWKFFQLALPILGYFALSSHLDTKKVLQTCFWILVGCALFQCVVAITQYSLQHSLGLKQLGEVTTHYNYGCAIFVQNKQRWLFDKLLQSRTPSQYILRPAGTLPHPNVLGGFLGMTIFASSYLFLSCKEAWKRGILGFSICLQIFTLGLTFSRAAIFGLGGSFALFFLLLWRIKGLRKRALILMVPFLVSGFLGGVILKDQFIQRGGIVHSNIQSKKSDRPRLYYQKIALEMTKKRPLFGQGWNQFLIDLEPQQPENFFMQKVHNIYLLILAETGVFGFLAFFSFLGSLLYWTWKKGCDLITATMGCLFAFFLWVGLVDHYWISTPHGRLIFFLMAALLSSYVLPRKEPQSLSH